MTLWPRYRYALAWGLFILALCTVPGRSIPDSEIASLDKLVHFGVFFVLAWLWMPPSAGKWASAQVSLGGTMYAAFTELYQGWLPWERTPDPFDFLANVVGLLLGVLSFVAIRTLQASRQP